MCKELEPLGLDVKKHVGQIGVVVDLKIPGSHDFIALRADMDALPMSEENDHGIIFPAEKAMS